MKGTIYKITNPSGKIYIGQTIDIKRRKRAYETLRCKKQSKIYNSLKKYGWDAHTFDMIEEIHIGINKCILNIREIYWIKEFNCFEQGLNCNIGGGSGVGQKAWNKGLKTGPLSEEHKNKIKTSSNERTITDEQREKMSAPWKGKKRAHSQETKNKIKNTKLLLAQSTVYINPKSKKVSVDGIIYNTITKASLFLGISRNTILSRSKNKKYSNYYYV